MVHYRVYKIGLDGHFISGGDLQSDDDEAAIEAAKRFVDGCDVELWEGRRKVIRLEHPRTLSRHGQYDFDKPSG